MIGCGGGRDAVAMALPILSALRIGRLFVLLSLLSVEESELWMRKKVWFSQRLGVVFIMTLNKPQNLYIFEFFLFIY